LVEIQSVIWQLLFNIHSLTGVVWKTTETSAVSKPIGSWLQTGSHIAQLASPEGEGFHHRRRRISAEIRRQMGMRNGRELYRMRIENIDWNNRVIFNPNSKTKKGRRFIPMSDRVLDILLIRRAGREEGWVFPSDRRENTSSEDW